MINVHISIEEKPDGFEVVMAAPKEGFSITALEKTFAGIIRETIEEMLEKGIEGQNGASMIHTVKEIMSGPGSRK